MTRPHSDLPVTPLPHDGAGSIESDFLNGEVALLGCLHGVATPANSTLQHIAARLVREGASPGALTPDDVRAEISRAEAGAGASGG